jgi:glycosyltransferase involved in cell wall biosynthesis
MRILFVSETYYPHLNGVYYFVCRLAPLLKAKGHEVAIIAPAQAAHFSISKIDNIDVYLMPSAPLLLYPKLRFTIPALLESKIEKIMNGFNPDVIHIQDHFILSKAVIEVNKKLHIPIIGTNHFMPENVTSLFKNEMVKSMVERFLWRRFSNVFNQVSLVTTPTETGAQLIRSKLNTRVIPISCGISLEEFNTPRDKQTIIKKYNLPDGPILLYAGRVDPEKRIEEILEAFAMAVKTIDCYFVVVGKGVRKAPLEEMARKLKIDDRVIFTGFVPNEDLPFFYKISRCFIIASRAELQSLVTLQAIASGLPVIAADAGALGELVHDKVNGYLFKTGDIKTMVRSINKIFINDGLQQQMSEKSVSYSLDHDIHQTVALFEKVYRNCCKWPIVTSINQAKVNTDKKYPFPGIRY